MTQDAFLPVFRVSGTNYEIGLEVGRNFKNRIKTAFEQSVIYQYLLGQDKLNPAWFDRLHDYAEKYFPQYLEEISGIAEGSGFDYRDVAIVNFRGSHYIESCSTVIFKQPGKIIVGHNEDHEQILGEEAYLLIVELQDGTSFLAYTYPGCLPGFSFSFNSHGLVQGANALPDPAVKMGVPRHLLDRSMLEAITLEDALQRAQFSPRSGAFSYNLASMNEQKAANLETTSEKTSVTEVDTKYFHTNHYVSKALMGIPIPPGSTLIRYERGVELLPHVEMSPNEALRILSDNKVFLSLQESPRTPYTPYGPYYGGTLCTALFEVSEDIVLRIYPPKQEKEGFLQFSLTDLM